MMAAVQRPALLLACVVFLAACAATPSPVVPIPEGDFRERIETQEARGVRVSAAVPSASETRALFGKPLYKRGIQPVWLQIENLRERPFSFLPVGLDPMYYSPSEVALMDSDATRTPASLAEQFLGYGAMERMTVPPGETLSGFVFTRLDEGTKAFNVDIKGAEEFISFTFFIQVPGLAIDHYTVDWRNLYRDDEWVALDKAGLIAALEAFPCCVTDKSGENTGDPLNLVLIGMPRDIYTAFIRADWDETETVTRASGWKTVKSFLSGGEYRYSPVSSLYVFDRPQDVAFQKARETIHERNHLRLWLTHTTYEGLPVWIGQISRDIGVRFTPKTVTTHKIDPNVDETREYLLENLAYAQSLKAIAYVGGVGEVSMERPRGNLTGDPWFTDGYRLVLWLSSKPVPISDLEAMQWRAPWADFE